MKSLSPHHHSGRYLPHHHTSYSSLLFITLLVGVVLVGVTAVAWAQPLPPNPGPVSANISVQAVVPGVVPKTAPVITAPANGQHFTSIPVDIRGTCEAGFLVNVYKNDVLAGAAICDRTGHFTMQGDLFIGRNDLIARMLNAANQASPDSNTITAYFDLPSTPVNLIDNSINGAHGNVIIEAESIYKGTVPGQTLTWTISVLGGVAPYALNVDWGDGTSDLSSRAQPGQFTISHTYKKAGGYKGGYVVGIKAVDSAGTSGFMQLVAVVNNPVGTAVTGSGSSIGGQLFLAWPIWVLVFFMIISFWLGDWRGRRHEDKHFPQAPVLGLQ